MAALGTGLIFYSPVPKKTLIQHLVLVPHLNASGYGQYVPRCDNAAAYNYYCFNHSYAPLILSPPCSSAPHKPYTAGVEPRA